MSGVYVRAKTSDGRYTSVDVVQLDERSFREFVAHQLARVGAVASVVGNEPSGYTTPLTYEEVEEV